VNVFQLNLRSEKFVDDDDDDDNNNNNNNVIKLIYIKRDTANKYVILN
jgi:hypothetical protein